jgi:hypothetical protein
MDAMNAPFMASINGCHKLMSLMDAIMDAINGRH